MFFVVFYTMHCYISALIDCVIISAKVNVVNIGED